MSDAPDFHKYATQALEKAAEDAEKALLEGRAADFPTYRYQVGYAKGLRDAIVSLYNTYKIVVEGVKPLKENDGGRKSSVRNW